MGISERLIQLRESKGWNKTETAKRLGVTVGAYANWEYGNREPTGKILTNISELFGVSIRYLVEGKKTLADYSKEELKAHIKEVGNKNFNQKLIVKSKIESEMIDQMLYDQFLSFDFENESEYSIVLLTIVFGLINTRGNEDSLIESVSSLVFELYGSEQPSLEDKLIILDRYYERLKKNFKEVENRIND